MNATQRFDRAQRLSGQLRELRRTFAQVIDHLDRLEREVYEEIRDAREAVLDEKAHHMDPHPGRPLSLLTRRG